MYPMLRTTPRAGARLTSHLRTLILEFGTYHPPFASLAGSASTAPRPTPVPPEILTDALIEEIKASYCFVGSPLDQFPLPGTENLRQPASQRDDRMDVDMEASHSHSQLLRVSPLPGHRSGYQSGVQSGTHTPSRTPSAQDAWVAQYERQSGATDFLVSVSPPAPLTGTGRGNLRIPGWIRERAAEYLFLGGDVDEPSVSEIILQTLLKASQMLEMMVVKANSL